MKNLARFNIYFTTVLMGMVSFLHDSQSAVLPSGYSEVQITDHLNDPTSLQFAPDGRLFILEQNGQIQVLKNGVLLKDPFLSLSVDSRGEHGVLGLAFDPNFNLNSYVYVYYTALTPKIHNRISRFLVKGDQAVVGSEKILFELDDTGNSIYHSAGALHFSKDGELFVGVGDNANRKNAQLLTNPFGKILRINSDGSIPTDNPFYLTGSGTGRAIWALGFRNPFTFHFQNQGSGLLYVNDVGAETWEDIKEVKKGGNYGWSLSEGESNDPRLISPVFVYGHGPVTSDTLGCAITGGTFYNPEHLVYSKQYYGQYFFIDYCSAWMRVFNPENHTVQPFGKQLASNPVSLEVGPDGNLYYLSRWYHALYTIRYQAGE